MFERKARDLYIRVPILLSTAVLGGEITVLTIGGKSLRLKIPPTTQNAQVFRLKGHGMPIVGKPDQTGDLYATVDVQLPKTSRPNSVHTSKPFGRSSSRQRRLRPDRREDTMNINKYTEKAQEAVLGAQKLAEQMSHPQIEPEHLLVSLLEQREGVAPEVLRKIAADPAQIARAARELLAKIPSAYGGAQPGLSPRSTWSQTSRRPKPIASRMITSAPSICSSRLPRKPVAPLRLDC